MQVAPLPSAPTLQMNDGTKHTLRPDHAHAPGEVLPGNGGGFVPPGWPSYTPGVCEAEDKARPNLEVEGHLRRSGIGRVWKCYSTVEHNFSTEEYFYIWSKRIGPKARFFLPDCASLGSLMLTRAEPIFYSDRAQ